VKWNIIKQPFPKDGLGIRDLVIFNDVLLGKWLWRFMNEKDKLWRAVIKAKYEAEGMDGSQVSIMALTELVFGSLLLEVRVVSSLTSFSR